MNYTTRLVRIQAANRLTRDFFKNASNSIGSSARSTGLGARGAFKEVVRAPSSGAGLRFQEIGVKAAASACVGALGNMAACMADNPVGAHEGCLLDLVLMVGDDGT